MNGTGTPPFLGGRVRHVAVVGDGQMGLVMAGIAAASPSVERVTLWCHEERHAEDLAQSRVSRRLDHFKLDPSVLVTPSGKRALCGPAGTNTPADLIVHAVPTQFTRAVWERLMSEVGDTPPEGVLRQPVVSVSKGFENGTLRTPTQIIRSVVEQHPAWPGSAGGGSKPVAVLSGPTIAGELARGLPATMVAASELAPLAEEVQRLFSTSYLRIYTNTDAVGVEVAGACKNVIAIAAGILDGLKAGFNAKSALLARGLAEIARLGVGMGARPDTFSGVAGAGDLATTCFSPEGRNRSLGEALGKGEKLSSYLERTRSVVEGVATSASVMALKERLGVDMPISEAVDSVLREEIDPIEGIALLMSREPKGEEVSPGPLGWGRPAGAKNTG